MLVFVTYTLIPFVIFGTLSLAIHAAIGIGNTVGGVSKAIGRGTQSVRGFLRRPVAREKDGAHSD